MIEQLIIRHKLMGFLEKCYSIFAIVFAFTLLASILLVPELRYVDKLFPLSLAGMIINIGLMFVVLRDILQRNFVSSNSKYTWAVLVLLLWPSILYYLPRHGFRPRT
jgi:hypothetical protein